MRNLSWHLESHKNRCSLKNRLQEPKSADDGQKHLVISTSRQVSGQKSSRFRHIVALRSYTVRHIDAVPTGLPAGPPEKKRQSSSIAWNRTLSPVPLASWNLQKCGVFSIFSG